MANRKKESSAATEQHDYAMLLAEETLILDAQMSVQRILNEKKTTQAELARGLGVSESYISHTLGDAARNLSLRTVARLMTALGETPQLTIKRRLEKAVECLRP